MEHILNDLAYLSLASALFAFGITLGHLKSDNFKTAAIIISMLFSIGLIGAAIALALK